MQGCVRESVGWKEEGFVHDGRHPSQAASPPLAAALSQAGRLGDYQAFSPLTAGCHPAVTHNYYLRVCG